MPKREKIWTVDAFTDKAFSGNPAAVVLIQDFLADNICQKIAAEVNLPNNRFSKVSSC